MTINQYIDKHRDVLKQYMWRCGFQGTSITDRDTADFIKDDEYARNCACDEGVYFGRW